MKIEINIREATMEDVSSLASLSGELDYATSSAEVKRRLPGILENELQVLYVAVSPDDVILGWIHVFISHRLMSDPFAELGGLVVTESHRDQGVGKLLLSKAEDWAKVQGCNLMIVRTRSTREKAHRFYEHSGYKLRKEQKVYEKKL